LRWCLGREEGREGGRKGGRVSWVRRRREGGREGGKVSRTGKMAKGSAAMAKTLPIEAVSREGGREEWVRS